MPKNIDPIRPKVRAQWEELVKKEGGTIRYGMDYFVFQVDIAIAQLEEHINTMHHAEINNHED